MRAAASTHTGSGNSVRWTSRSMSQSPRHAAPMRGAISAADGRHRRLLLPALTIYVAFTAYPVVRTLFNSLHQVRPGRADVYVGLGNYAGLWTDEFFWQAVTTRSSGRAPPPSSNRRSRCCWRSRSTPASRVRASSASSGSRRSMSFVVVGIIWMWIFNYDWGVVNTLLRAVGLERWAWSWLGSPTTALPALIFVTTWMWTGSTWWCCWPPCTRCPPKCSKRPSSTTAAG